MCSALAPPKHPPANSPESPSARIRCRFLRGNPVPHRVRKATVVRQEFATEPWRSAPARGVQPSRTLCGAGSHENLHQKLQNLRVALGFGQAFSLSIKPMRLQKESMYALRFPQRARDAVGQLYHVPRVLEDRQPLAVLVGFYRGQAIQHLVAFELDAAMPRRRPVK